MPDRTASKASHVFGESQSQGGSRRKNETEGKKEQSESRDEGETPGGQGVGEKDTVGGREREKLPRCLKMVHAPVPAPMTLYIPSTFPHKTSVPYIIFAYFA